MYRARIHRWRARPVEATGRGRTEEAALRNAASRLLGRRIRALYIERPVPGASTRWVYEAHPAPGGGLSLGDRMVAHVDHLPLDKGGR